MIQVIDLEKKPEHLQKMGMKKENIMESFMKELLKGIVVIICLGVPIILCIAIILVI